MWSTLVLGCIALFVLMSCIILVNSLAVVSAAAFAVPKWRRRSSRSSSTQVFVGTCPPSPLELEQQQLLQHARRPFPSWIIRPATVHDRAGCTALLQQSYCTLLPANYSAECLAHCLPSITQPREQLLTSNTWFVAEDPTTRQIVGCGGWSVRSATTTQRLSHNDTNINAATAISTAIGSIHDTNTLSNATSENQESPLSSTETDSSPQVARATEPPPLMLMPQLRHFAVHPDYTRMGIASAIWRHTMRDIQAHYLAEKGNLSFPTLLVYSTLTAESFYRSLGFVSLERVEFQFGSRNSSSSTNNSTAKNATAHDDSGNNANYTIFPTVLMRRDPRDL